MAKTFAVYVVDRRLVKYIVDAESAEDAREQIEASSDADADFEGKGLHSEWYVDNVEEM